MSLKQQLCLIGSYDTKGEDLEFMRRLLSRNDLQVLTLDTSVLGPASHTADVRPETVAAAGGASLEDLRKRGDRGYAMEIMREGLKAVVKDLYETRRIEAVIGLGGGAGTSVITAAMRDLPLGVPKLMVTTLASGQTDIYVGESDILMFPSIVDIAGVNRISSGVYRRAAGAIFGMLQSAGTVTADTAAAAGGMDKADRPLIAATMFGNTTDAVERCKHNIVEHGKYEPIIFHATGTGGKTMERLIEDGYIEGLIDMTTTEIADLIVGGVMSAGETRMEAAAKKGIPQIVVPGCVDMVNFRAPETVPEKYKHRLLYRWNPDVTLLRTNMEENDLIGKRIGENVNKAEGPLVVFLPLKGVSLLDSMGNEFWDPEADGALFQSIRKHCNPEIDIRELPYNINDQQFADTVTETFLLLMEEHEHAVY